MVRLVWHGGASCRTLKGPGLKAGSQRSERPSRKQKLFGVDRRESEPSGTSAGAGWPIIVSPASIASASTP